MSVTARPVKLNADVAVNSDVVNPDDMPVLDEGGRERAMVPIAINARKTAMKTMKNGAWLGGKRDRLRFSRTLSYIFATAQTCNSLGKIFG